jgi:hypothetical protein
MTEEPKKNDEKDPNDGELEDGDPIESMKAYVRERFDGNLPAGLQCSISRSSPSYSKGYMETMPADESFSLEVIKERLGGGYYTLKYLHGGKYVTTRRIEIEGPSKRDGEIVDDPQTAARKRQEAEQLRNQPAQANSDTGLAGVMATLMTSQQQMAQTASDNQLSLLREVMQSNNAAPVAPTLPVTNQLDIMAGYFDLFQKMRGTDDDDPDDFRGLLKDAFEIIQGKKEKEEGPPLIGAGYLNASPGPAQAQTEDPGATPQEHMAGPEDAIPGQFVQAMGAETIAQAIGEMDMDQALQMMVTMFQNIDPERKHYFVQNFMQKVMMGDQPATDDEPPKGNAPDGDNDPHTREQ